jgi:hypothetical protein
MICSNQVNQQTNWVGREGERERERERERELELAWRGGVSGDGAESSTRK